MTPQQFIAKWQNVSLSERSACQQHFLDLCALLEQPTPADADPQGTWYTFEYGVQKTHGGQGWADVWKKGHFGWEYKGKHKDLDAAYNQLLRYREALENPPLLVVCDLDRFEVHTNFTGTVKRVYRFDLAGLADPHNLHVLRRLFTDPQALKPGETPEGVTERVAELFGQIADALRARNVPPGAAAHFLMKLMFCMFAEDIELLTKKEKLFARVLKSSKGEPQKLAKNLRELFTAMCGGGDFWGEDVLHFNGGLFADADVIELQAGEIQKLSDANIPDWSNVEPSVFGTLFERTLDPDKRSQIGAHYTSREDIETLLEPVVMQPLRREWQAVQARCEEVTRTLQASGSLTAATKRKKLAARDKLLRAFVERLAHVTILDPACGSGNFLYVALHLLLDLEKEVISYAARQQLGLLPHVRPTQLAGIEINPYAQELASVVIWIGYLQWMRHNGFNPPNDPVLEPIESIRRMDAILDLSDAEHPLEPEWPEAEFIVGNPPFLGGNKVRAQLGDEYVDSLFRVYDGRLSAFTDLCAYWLEKARSRVQDERATRVGLLATQGIRGGVNREVLQSIKRTGSIFFAESDRDWILDGAHVHVSMIGFDDGAEAIRVLDGKVVTEINADLSARPDVTQARRLSGTRDNWCYGSQQKADFDISPELAIQMLQMPNAATVANSDVLRPSVNGAQLLRRTHETFVIDFGMETQLERAARYEAPFEHVRKHIFPGREHHREPRQRRFWWLHARPSPTYRSVLAKGTRYVVTAVVAKHRIFVWGQPEILVDHATVVFPSDEESRFGVLHSRVHEAWARALATQVRDRKSGLRYTPKSCFETFPFPEPTDAQREAIAAAVRELDELRQRWLDPPEWTRTEVLKFPGSADGPWRRYIDPATVDSRGIGTVRYPRIVAKDEDSAKLLKKRTLTNLYNERPTWLDLAHQKLDATVFAAYGWDAGMADEELLAKLLELNRARA
jgi:type II restriction/modification system DNA methylase subunit YeeA